MKAIQEMDAIVPRYPKPGQPATRNTEYPFQLHGGGWTAPCEVGTFTPKEITRFEVAAARVHGCASKLISALERLFPAAMS